MLLSVMATGCSPTFYVPNTQNVPLIESKGQTNLSLAGNSNQYEFQGAYGITQSLAVQLNGGLMVPAELDNGNRGSGKFLEAGAGYYKSLSKNLLFEGYGLVGIGNFLNNMPSTLTAYPGTTGKLSANLLRVGIQPALSLHWKWFSLSGSFRLASLSYSNIEGSLWFDNADQVAFLTDNKSTLIFEPAITIKAGLERVKLQIQLAKCWNLSNPDFRQDDKLLTAGLNFILK